jgi:pimeloyl-ACP methyl ester carboxylesterase
MAPRPTPHDPRRGSAQAPGTAPCPLRAGGDHHERRWQTGPRADLRRAAGSARAGFRARARRPRESATWTRATLLDLPGWRAGRPRSCAATLPGVASATADWLQATDRHHVILLGHSTGAQSVLRTALQVPDRVTGVVLAGPTFDPAARTISALVRRAASTILHERPAELLAAGPSYLHSGGLPLLRFLLSALPDRPEDLVPLLTAPVLVITGEHDGIAPPAWARHLAALASAPCVVLPGAHNAPFPHPREADAAVREFTLTG